MGQAMKRILKQDRIDRGRIKDLAFSMPPSVGQFDKVLLPRVDVKFDGDLREIMLMDSMKNKTDEKYYDLR